MLILSCFIIFFISLWFYSNSIWFFFSMMFLFLFNLQIVVGYSQFIFLSFFLFDDLFYWLSLVSVILSFFSFYCIGSVKDIPQISVSMVFLLVCCLIVFASSYYLYLYLAYEASLLPIVYIISNWGSYPDRGVSGSLMLIYTAVFSFPFICVVIWWFISCGALSFFSVSTVNFPLWVFLLTFIAFSVNLPLYGVHQWLPIAHVEAPTFGSIILAGLLLNIGGCGLLRFWGLLGVINSHINLWVFSYCIICIVLASVVTSFQSDINRLVAYSSVVHISILVLLLNQFHSLSVVSFLVLMVTHAFSSPLLFLLTGVVYNVFFTRMLFFIRGAFLVFPMLGFLLTLAFALSLPTPPFFSFLGEVIVFISVLGFSSGLALFVFLVVFISLVYNILWFISSVVGPLSISTGNIGGIGFHDFLTSVIFVVYSLFLVFMVSSF